MSLYKNYFGISEDTALPAVEDVPPTCFYSWGHCASARRPHTCCQIKGHDTDHSCTYCECGAREQRGETPHAFDDSDGIGECSVRVTLPGNGWYRCGKSKEAHAVAPPDDKDAIIGQQEDECPVCHTHMPTYACTVCQAETIGQLQTEVAVLRGEDCEADGDGPCGVCLKCCRRYRAKVEQQAETIRQMTELLRKYLLKENK